MAPEITGVQFTNELSDAAVAVNRILENGSGVALGDVDGDGWCDIYLCRIQGSNALYRNLRGWRFKEIAVEAGVSCPGQASTGAALVDIDGDGDLDLVVNAIGGGTRAFRNNAAGRFTEILDGRLVRSFGSTSMTFGDIDGDGDLDLYVTNYRTDTYRDSPPGLKVDARRVGNDIQVTPADRFWARGVVGDNAEIIERGERDFLYLNDGTGRFAPVSWTSGSFADEAGAALKAPPLEWGLSAMFRDADHDLDPDLYVCNDFFHSPDQFWLNQQGTGFRAIAPTAWRVMSASSMAVDFADINRDGFDDLIVGEMLSRSHEMRQRRRENLVLERWNLPVTDPDFRPEVPRNTLFLNRGDGTYVEIAQFAGVSASEWTWGLAFLDVDLDGFEDILVANGNNRDVQDSDVMRANSQSRLPPTPEGRLSGLVQFPRVPTPKIAFRNQGNLTFKDSSQAWGFDSPQAVQGMALGDLDNDGDLDVVFNSLNAPALLLRNNAPAPRITVRLKGLPANTAGIGARISLTGGAVDRQDQEIISGGRYLSCDEAIRVFAAGASSRSMQIEVVWRSGRRTAISGVSAGRLYELAEPTAPPTPAADPPVRRPHFQNLSSQINYQHRDGGKDLLSEQPLLSRKLGHLGPGLAWGDADRDGDPDLLVSGGGDSHPVLFLNLGNSGFSEATPKSLARTQAADQTSVLIQPMSAGSARLWIGLLQARPNATNSNVLLTGSSSEEASSDAIAFGGSVGPMALADVDADGELEVFVGGRVIPGKYPWPASSGLYRREGNGWKAEGGSFGDAVGLVSGAVFSDLTGDGVPELVLAVEWGPIRVFRRQQGKWVDLTGAFGLDRETGWWTGVTTGDFDADGRMDIAAANWGLNTKYRAYDAHPLHVFAVDPAGTGNPAVIEAYFDLGLGKVVPWPDLSELSRVLPEVHERYPTFKAYANAGMEEILGGLRQRALHLEVRELGSAVFFNRGDRFEKRLLPAEAQFAPTFGIGVADFDGDGKEDLVLAQNFFHVEPQTSRYDAGQLLLLKGDGIGGFQVIPGRESGLELFGEGRGLAVADFDSDGRPDLAVGVNQGKTGLYRNVAGREGLHVRLQGTPGNPAAFGAQLRLQNPGFKGPIREIHAGSGYWSQDDAAQVLFGHREGAALWVRWPGGRETVTPLPQAARRVRVDSEGSLVEVR